MSAAFAPHASAQAAASISDLTPVPGQWITVRAGGLQPGAPVLIDLHGDGIRLAELNAGAGGEVAHEVQIPPGTRDGKKAIVITSIDAAGTYAHLPIEFQVAGPPASVRLSTTRLGPGQVVRVTGARFEPGSPVSLVLFPEEVLLGSPIAAADGSFTTSVRMPVAPLNGRHGFVAAGATAGGGFAYLVVDVDVTGGSGSVPPGYSVPSDHPLARGRGLSGGTTARVSSTSSSTTTTTSEVRSRMPRAAPSDPDRDGADPAPLVALAVFVALSLLAIGGTWLRSADGRRWLRRRRTRR